MLDIREQVNYLNKMRLEVAKKKGVANMHEVTWDQTLESKIKKMTCDERTSSGSDYVVFGISELKALKTNKKDDIKNPLYHPLQTKIACGKIMCNDESLCLLGPK